MIKSKTPGPTSEELFWRTTDQVVDHLNRGRGSGPSIKREDPRGFPADREGIEWERHRREVSPSLWNERDIMFQVRVMDWMIGFCVTALVVVLCVGVWAIWQMLTIGWRG